MGGPGRGKKRKCVQDWCRCGTMGKIRWKEEWRMSEKLEFWDIYDEKQCPFVIIIDEWDIIFRKWEMSTIQDLWWKAF